MNPANETSATGLNARFNRADYLSASIAAFVSLSLYLPSISTRITGEDAGELAAAAYVLGIPHPPGYPLWCLLAHVFTWIPLYTVAWRVAFFSAFMGAATVFVLVLLCRRLSGSRWASVLCGVTLAASLDFYLQSIIPEVYTLNAFFVALCWLLLTIWHESRDVRLLWWLAFVYGLSLANHNTMLLLGPLFALFILAVERPALSRLSRYFAMTALSLAVAFLLYTYLPLRSLANPPVDWGNPETLANWWRHVTRGQYEFMLTQNERSWPRFLMQLEVLGGYWLLFHYGLLPVLGLLGFVLHARRHKAPVALIGVSGLLVSLAFLLIQNPDKTAEWMEVMKVFNLPLSMSVAVGAAMFIGGLTRWWIKALASLAMVVVVALTVAFVLQSKLGEAKVVDSYARKVFDLLPPDSVLVPSADHQSFPLLYLQVVEGLRPDVTLARKYGYLDMDLFPAELRGQYGDFPPRRFEPELFDWLVQNDPRPIFFFKEPKFHAARVIIEDCWLLKRALRGGEESPALDSDRCGLDVEDPVLTKSMEERFASYTARAITLEYTFRAAEWGFLDNVEDAENWLDKGLYFYGRDSTSLYNAGALCARYQRYEQAREYFEAALAWDSAHQPSRDALERLDRLGH